MDPTCGNIAEVSRPEQRHRCRIVMPSCTRPAEVLPAGRPVWQHPRRLITFPDSPALA
jgi:hypothetical protein